MPPKAAIPQIISPLGPFFMIESVANIISALQMIFFPRFTLNMIIVKPSSSIVHPASQALQPVALQLTQFLGGILIALTVPMLFAIRDPAGLNASSNSTPPSTPKPASPSALLIAIRSHGIYRKRLYLALATGEVVLSCVIFAHLFMETSPTGTPGALKPGFLIGAIMTLLNLAALRAWAIICRAHWFGGFAPPLPPKKTS